MKRAELLERSGIRLACASLLVSALGVAAYGWTVSVGLIGADTLPLIAESRVQSVGGLVDVLTDELMGGRNPVVRFYRPVSQAFYVIESAAFGLNPVGYQVVSLLLHLLCAAGTVLLTYRWTESVLTAALAGAIFAIHPLHEATIPYPSRVQDILMCVIGLGVLLAHERALRTGARAAWVAMGLMAGLALLAKETGILFSALVVLSQLLRGSGGPIRRVVTPGVWLLPFVIPALLLRFGLSFGLGGYGGGSFQILGTLPFPMDFFRAQSTELGFISNFLTTSLDPAKVLGSLGAPWAALPVLFLLAVRERRAAAALSLTWLGIMLCGALSLRVLRAQALLPWSLYAAVPALAALIATATVDGIRGAKRVWPLSMAAGALVLMGGQLLSTPLFTRARALRSATSVQDQYYRALDDAIRTRSPGSTVVRSGPMPWALDMPLFFAHGNVMLVGPWTVDAWMELEHPEVPASVQDTRDLFAAPDEELRILSDCGFVSVDASGAQTDSSTRFWLLHRPEELKRLAPLKAAVGNRPGDANAWFALGQELWRLKKLGKAEATLRVSTRLAPNFWEARMVLAEVLSAEGRPRAAEKQLVEVLRLRPGFEPAEARLAQVREELQANEALSAQPSGNLKETVEPDPP